MNSKSAEFTNSDTYKWTKLVDGFVLAPPQALGFLATLSITRQFLASFCPERTSSQARPEVYSVCVSSSGPAGK